MVFGPEPDAAAEPVGNGAGPQGKATGTAGEGLPVRREQAGTYRPRRLSW